MNGLRIKEWNQNPRYLVRDDGKVYDTKREILVPAHLTGGDNASKRYERDSLLSSEGTYEKVYAHRAVAIHFLEETYETGLVVNHIDHDVTNNNVENLEWVTQKQNVSRAAGRSNKTAINNDTIRLIRSLSESGVSAVKLAANFGLQYLRILRIVNYKTYKNVLPENYRMY